MLQTLRSQIWFRAGTQSWTAWRRHRWDTDRRIICGERPRFSRRRKRCCSAICSTRRRWTLALHPSPASKPSLLARALGENSVTILPARRCSVLDRSTPSLSVLFLHSVRAIWIPAWIILEMKLHSNLMILSSVTYCQVLFCRQLYKLWWCFCVLKQVIVCCRQC